MNNAVRFAMVHHSGYGHIRKPAEAIRADAASVMGVESVLMPVEEIGAHWIAPESVDAIIFGAPTYMGSASAQFKAFMDASSRTAFAAGAWKDKIAAGFTNAACRSGYKPNKLAILAAQLGCIRSINLGLPPGHNCSTSSEDTMNRHGDFLGAAAQNDADVSANDGGPENVGLHRRARGSGGTANGSGRAELANRSGCVAMHGAERAVPQPIARERRSLASPMARPRKHLSMNVLLLRATAANHDMHVYGMGGQEYRGLTCRLASTHQDHSLFRAQFGFHRGRPIVDASAFGLHPVRNGWATIDSAACDDNRARPDRVTCLGAQSMHQATVELYRFDRTR